MEKDNELKQIIEMELNIEEISSWTNDIVQTSIDQIKPCGGYQFPNEILEVLDAINGQKTPFLVHGCYTVENNRKREAEDYCQSLEAWLAKKSPDLTAMQVEKHAWRKIDWIRVCANLWDVLDGHS